MKRSSDILLCCVCTLLALGAVMVFSVLAARGSDLVVGVKYLGKHLLWVAISLAAFFMARRTDYHVWERWWKPMALATLVLLAVVLIPGVGTLKYGARRWIRLGPVGFQPSEVAKLTLIVALAALGARWEGVIRTTWRPTLLLLGLVGLCAALVLAEPDFGTAALLGMMGILLIIQAGGRWSPILGAGAAGAGGLALLLLQSPARMARITAFLDPWAHQDAAGYQAIHSLVALGSGGFLGREGMEKLYYLPQADTDFILAIIGEELGLVGTLGVIALFLLIIRQGLKISEAAPDAFGRLLASGISGMIALQAMIHIAVVTVSMPTKGIALPFVSAGGSSLAACMAATGVLLNVARQARAEPAEASESGWRQRLVARARGLLRRTEGSTEGGRT